MTRDEAINTLANFKVYISGGGVTDKKANEALDLAIATLVHLPSANRPKGRWIDKGDYAECSNCGANSGTQFDSVEPVPRKTKFCPNCGCRMRGAGDEEST